MKIEEARLRHASHYQRALAFAHERYLAGGAGVDHGLSLFDLYWPNVRIGHAWSVQRCSKNRAAAALCMQYQNSGLYILYLRQHPRERIEWLEAAARAARILANTAEEGRHLSHLGVAYKELGDPRRAIEYHEGALRMFREIGDRRGEGGALDNLGAAWSDLGDVRRSADFFESGLKVNRDIGERRGELASLLGLGGASVLKGDNKRAV